jgi:Lrp/AsnC family leucine-responsive transcriptional regulator
MKLDSTNWKILKLLQENARINNTEIARQIGISSPAVAERIRKLEDGGVIERYVTKVSYYEAGYQLRALITVRAFMGRLRPFLLKVKSFNEVVNCHRITGNENIVLEVVLRNQKHLEKFIDELITYGETKTHIILSSVLEDKPIRSY